MFREPDMIADAMRLPFPDNHADVICSVHMIEHLYKWDAEKALNEWHRILKPNGKLVIELPSMDKVFTMLMGNLLSGTDEKESMTWWAIWGDPMHEDPAMAHKWGYTAMKFHLMLEKHGFKDVVYCDPKYHVKERDMRFEATK